MSILVGILLYGFVVLFFCALTRANGPETLDPFAQPQRDESAFEPAPPHGAVHAREAQL